MCDIFVPLVSLQEPRGPLQPLRLRGPPVKMPREVEVRPKHCQRPKGGQRQGEEASGVKEMEKGKRECKLVVLTGREDTAAHCRLSWSLAGPSMRLLVGSDCTAGNRTE